MGPKYAVIICARQGSTRAPGKIFYPINGMNMLHHFVERISKKGHPLMFAVPGDEEQRFKVVTRPDLIFPGVAGDPMLRQYHAGRALGVDYIIRITADKVFIESDLIHMGMQKTAETWADYLYSDDFTLGTRFEIISMKALEEATKRFQNVEHVTYAIQSVAKTQVQFDIPKNLKSTYSFLLDYPEDFSLMETILQANGNDCSLADAIQWMDKNPWAQKLNKRPAVTVYTCAYNADKWLEKTMGSVSEQINFKDIEYILIDDFSQDRSFQLMAKFKTKYSNVKLVRNPKNLGLASSSNVAVNMAKGKYIMRLDADDYFSSNQSVIDAVSEIQKSGKDAIYPSNYFGSHKRIQKGNEQHHAGGAIFSAKALEHLKFNEGLTGFEGYDLFKRAEKQLKIGYLDAPIFFYRQRADSLSHTNIEERAKIKASIDAQLSM